MQIESLTEQYFLHMLMVISRLSPIIMFMPGMGNNIITNYTKILLIITLSFVILPMVQHNLPDISLQITNFFQTMLSEFLIGLLIAVILQILFSMINTGRIHHIISLWIRICNII